MNDSRSLPLHLLLPFVRLSSSDFRLRDEGPRVFVTPLSREAATWLERRVGPDARRRLVGRGPRPSPRRRVSVRRRRPPRWPGGGAMKKNKVVPFESRPARPPEERVERAVERQVDDARRDLQGDEHRRRPRRGLREVDRAHPHRPRRERPTPAELVYRVGPANDGVVFATPERARYVANLFDALDSKTWGEFRSRIPPRNGSGLRRGSTSFLGPASVSSPRTCRVSATATGRPGCRRRSATSSRPRSS